MQENVWEESRFRTQSTNMRKHQTKRDREKEKAQESSPKKALVRRVGKHSLEKYE